MASNQCHQATLVPVAVSPGYVNSKRDQAFAIWQQEIVVGDPASVSQGADETGVSLELVCGRKSANVLEVYVFPDEWTKGGVPVSGNLAAADKIGWAQKSPDDFFDFVEVECMKHSEDMEWWRLMSARDRSQGPLCLWGVAVHGRLQQ